METTPTSRLLGIKTTQLPSSGTPVVGVSQSFWGNFIESNGFRDSNIILKPETDNVLVWLARDPSEQDLQTWLDLKNDPVVNTISSIIKETGIVIDGCDAAPNEVETTPTYSLVEIWTEEIAIAGKLENVWAAMEIPDLIRKCIEVVPGLRDAEEEDVRLWIKRDGEVDFNLIIFDENDYVADQINGVSSPMMQKDKRSNGGTALDEDEEDLPEELDDEFKPIPTLRTTLGKESKANQKIHVLLETRSSPIAKFARPLPVSSKRILAGGLLKRGDLKSEKTKNRKSGGISAITTRDSSTSSFSLSAGPRQGQSCDAQRSTDKKWYEARISRVIDDQDSVVVHYLSFPSKADEIVLANSERIQPPYTKVPDWRKQLKVGEEIDVHRSAIALRRGGYLYKSLEQKSGKSAWVNGTVIKVEHAAQDPRVLVRVKIFGVLRITERMVWTHADSEKLAPRFTHVAKPKLANLGPQSVAGTPPHAGIVGLRNLGNTCYMNSMIQCLAHTDAFKEYFISGNFVNELNRRNPLGMGGQLAEAFADVLSGMWSNEYDVVAPASFKQVLGNMNSQFRGFQQHDSQELLTLLADGLHEDLNRVKQKPVTDAVEVKGRPDDVVAKESWDVFQKRNDSKIVDEMYGLMKSHLTCPDCGKQAIKFDPYSNVSVPVPSLDLMKVRVLFIPKNPNEKVVRMTASVPKRGTALALGAWIAVSFKIPDADDVIIADVFGGRTYGFFHRPLTLLGPESDVPSADAERKNMRDFEGSNVVVAYQTSSRGECVSAARMDLGGFEVAWAAMVSLLVENDEDLEKAKEILQRNWMDELCGLFPFSQRRLTRDLQKIKNQSFAVSLAKEAVRLVSESPYPAAWNCMADSSLSTFANPTPESSPVAKTSYPDLGGANTTESKDDEENTSITSSQDRLMGGNSGSINLTNAGNSSGSNGSNGSLVLGASPIVKRPSGGALQKTTNFFKRVMGGGSKTNDKKTPTLVSGSNGSSEALSLGPSLASVNEKFSRVFIEVQHSRVDRAANKAGTIKRNRAPWFIAINVDRTWSDVRKEIEKYVETRVLIDEWPEVLAKAGTKATSFDDDEDDENAAGAAAAQMELTSPSQRKKKLDGGNGSPLRSPTPIASNTASLYRLEVDATGNHGQMLVPTGPVPIIEALGGRTLNSLIVYLKWTDECAADFVFRAQEQLDSNPYRVKDADLGFGQIGLFEPPKSQDDNAKQVLTLQDCMDVFRKREQLGEDDPWFCDQCKAHRCAFKTLDLWDAPKTLVVHLKRFLYEKASERVQREKITDLVEFPLKGFDVGPMLANKKTKVSTVYDLFAVSNHMGGLGGGHYTAYVKADNDTWWLMNDASVSEVDDPNDVVSADAYVLFYQRREKKQ